MSGGDEKVKNVKGFEPRAIALSEKIDKELGDALSSLYVEVWGEGEIPMKYKHLIAFAIAASNNNEESTLKIIERLAKFGATKGEIIEVLKLVVWTSGVQVFTDLAGPVMREMEKRGL
ncbi:MAG: carboxymuconolactone decarboxylase family protein [Methermicoccaceae archaeon]